MRAFLVSLLVVVVIVLVPFADLGVWVQRELGSTTSFVNLGEEVLQQSAVRDALAQQIVSDVASGAPAVAGRAATLEPVVAGVLAQPSVRPALDQVLANTHDQLRNGHDPLQLDLSPLLPTLHAQLPAFLASRLPSQLALPPVTVLRRSDAPAVWDGVQLVQQTALVLPIAMLLAVGGALVAARRRGGVCVAVGLATSVLAVGLVALIEPGRSVLEHQSGTPAQRAAFLAGYDTVTHTFVQQTVVLAVLGVALTVGGLLAYWYAGRRVRPSGWA
jgi:hypothetical protein